MNATVWINRSNTIECMECSLTWGLCHSSCKRSIHPDLHSSKAIPRESRLTRILLIECFQDLVVYQAVETRSVNQGSKHLPCKAQIMSLGKKKDGFNGRRVHTSTHILRRILWIVSRTNKQAMNEQWFIWPWSIVHIHSHTKLYYTMPDSWEERWLDSGNSHTYSYWGTEALQIQALKWQVGWGICYMGSWSNEPPERLYADRSGPAQ